MAKDIQDLAFLFNDYETRKNNYHFLNSELFELNRIESEIKAIISKYDDNLPGLMELLNGFPKIIDFISSEKLKSIQELTAQIQIQSNSQYYSLDGQVFSSLEDAIARNNEIMKNMESSYSPKSL